MNKEKQIEEKMKVISDICPFYKEYGTCEQCNTELDVDDEPCYWECMANAIIRYGYRKASEVAREIFAEIENALGLLRKGIAEGQKNDGIKYQQLHDGRIISLEAIAYFTAELKKKYTEGEKDNG
jgi:hypothetical protein